MVERIAIYQCPAHPRFVTLNIESRNGCGTRVCGGKCCVRQYENCIASWPISEKLIEELTDEMRAVLLDAR